MVRGWTGSDCVLGSGPVVMCAIGDTAVRTQGPTAYFSKSLEDGPQCPPLTLD